MLERYLIRLKFISFKNLKILFGRYLIPLKFIVFKSWRFFFKVNLSQWYLLILRIWRFCCTDTLSLWHLLFLKNLKILLERHLIPLKFISFRESEEFVWKIPCPTDLYYFLRILRFCWKDTLSHWNLLFFKSLKILFERYVIPLRISGFFSNDTFSQWNLLVV